MPYTTPSPAFAKLLMDLGRQPQERTRDELFAELGLDEEGYYLNKLAKADRILLECGVEVRPGIQDAPRDGTLLLRQKNVGPPTEAALLKRLAMLESASQEFKSTYWCDLKRLRHQPGASNSELRSASVKHSSLKSIAGFLTTGGGTLFIGVGDSGEILGLDADLEILDPKRQNIDQLINNIRTDIVDKFRDGDTVNDYVTAAAVEVGNTQILQLDITSRRTLSFLAPPKGDYQLFRRQGNRTTVVKVYEFEEFQTRRNENILPVIKK